MIRKTYPYLVVLFVTSILFASCLKSSDDDYVIDEVWKQRNEAAFDDASESGVYTHQWKAPGGNGSQYVLAKKSTVITDSDQKTIAPRISSDGRPEFGDSIQCRYEGWYFDKDNKKIIFDSTENRPTGSTGYHPNKVARTFIVSGVIEGWRAALQNMKVGEEVEIVIPWNLAYGVYGSGSIPGYTTLYFDVKILKIIQMKGQS